MSHAGGKGSLTVGDPLRNIIDSQSRIIAAHDELDFQLVFRVDILFHLLFIGHCTTDPVEARHVGLPNPTGTGALLAHTTRRQHRR